MKKVLLKYNIYKHNISSSAVRGPAALFHWSSSEIRSLATRSGQRILYKSEYTTDYRMVLHYYVLLLLLLLFRTHR